VTHFRGFVRLVLFVSFLFSLLVSVEAVAHEAETNAKTIEDGEVLSLNIAHFHIPPLMHTAIDGSFSGTMGETVKILCKEAKLNCFFENKPLKRSYRALERGDLDALITIDAGQFNDCCVASKWFSPWAAGIFSFSPFRNVPEKEEDMYGRKIILVHGMQSPYLFMPNLDKLSRQGKIDVAKAQDIKTAVGMFEKKRAPYLWGSDDFNWYFYRMDTGQERVFTEIVTKPVVIWVQKSKIKALKRLNKAFDNLHRQRLLNNKHLLVDKLMKQKYREAPFEQ
jgi:hypothetical protein